MIKDLPDLSAFEEAAKAGRISRHSMGDLVGFKYTAATVYAQDWDLVTLNARGIVFDSTTGKVVAFPFRKFFNYSELYGEPRFRTLEDGTQKEIEPLIDKVSKYETFKPRITNGIERCMDKLDGSLGICFYHNGKWYVKTGGSFDSDQAMWANQWLSRNVNTALLLPDKTYLFEIIYSEDIHPIKYDFDGMVLLSVVDLDTGCEMPTDFIVDTAKLLNVRVAEVYSFSNLDEIIPFAKSLPVTKEGVVVTFNGGFKCKVKGDEFLSLQRLFHALSMKYVWHSYDPVEDKFYMNLDKHNQWKRTDDKELFIPEELTEVQKYADSLRSNIKKDLEYVVSKAKQACHMCPEQRARYGWVVDHTKDDSRLTGVVLSLAGKIARDVNGNGYSLNSILVNIWKLYKPTKDFKYLEAEEI